MIDVNNPWDMCRNIHQDKKVRYIVISVRVNVRKKVQLEQERVRAYYAQSIRIECAGRQTL